jgi:hypothetical protein
VTEYLDRLEPWAFNGIPLAVESASVKIGIRTHKHIYPHTPGAAIEKMGRNPYEIDISGKFDSNLRGRYIDSMRSSIAMAGFVEDELTCPLVIPWAGTVKCLCEEFTRDEKNTYRSGLTFHAKFTEDTTDGFPILAFIKTKQAPIQTKLVIFKNAFGLDETTVGVSASAFQGTPRVRDIFSAITEVSTFIFGIKDQFQLYSQLIRSKLDYLETLFREADALADWIWSDIVKGNAFMGLWEAIRDFGDDIASKGLSFSYYTVPVMMSIQQIAVAIYRDSSKTMDLLCLNAIENALRIPPGTQIRYYAQE